MGATPYANLPDRALWRPAVGAIDASDIRDLPTPRRRLKSTELVATAGSCFAQHIAKRLKASGFNFLDVEPAPPPLESPSDFGYDLYSARYGNVYTSTQLRQLLERARGRFEPEERVWEGGGRYFDPFRPSVEPNGFASREEALASQRAHEAAVGKMFKRAEVFIFTLGLTEAWRSRSDGAIYPTCPGTTAGTFDAEKYEFVNLTYDDVMRDMRHVIKVLGHINPGLRFVLTVSPVPLTATASGEHILVATTYSKSVLRAAAGALVSEFDHVDYFPSYEIINSPVFEGAFFEPNRRSVRPEGVDFVMRSFFRDFCEGGPPTDAPVRQTARKVTPITADEEFNVLCDEEGLDPGVAQ